MIYFRKKKPEYLKFDKYWHQRVDISRHENREFFFQTYCTDKRVLHFGCTDWPIFNPKNNLHIKLSKYCKVLHGFDVDVEGIKQLREFVDEDYFHKITQVKGISYDVCLIPETIEHVDNAAQFLKEISEVDAGIFLITAPNCFSRAHINRNFYDNDYFIEIVHPDHNCWYSPFTLKNQIEKYSSLNVNEIVLLEEEKMICCVCTKKMN